MSSKGSNIDVNALFGTAADLAIISPNTLATLTTVDLGDQIQAAMGVTADAIEASEVFILTMLEDDSSSIRDNGNEKTLRDGSNLVLDSLAASKAENDILVMVSALNRGVIFPYCRLPDVGRLDSTNFTADGPTPLYDKTIAVLGAVLAMERQFAAQGVPVRTATLITSDGADYGSRSKPAQVAELVKDLRRRENHIIAAMGIDDGSTDFRKVFEKMGIDPRWVLTPGNDPHSIRQAFQVFSQSSVQASQGAQAFSKLSGLGT